MKIIITILSTLLFTTACGTKPASPTAEASEEREINRVLNNRALMPPAPSDRGIAKSAKSLTGVVIFGDNYLVPGYACALWDLVVEGPEVEALRSIRLEINDGSEVCYGDGTKSIHAATQTGPRKDGVTFRAKENSMIYIDGIVQPCASNAPPQVIHEARRVTKGEFVFRRELLYGGHVIRGALK